MAAGDVLFPGAPWLFPSRSSKTGEVIATQVWKEKALPSETGHILRHTYRTIAQRAGIDRVNARLLLDHTVPGIDGVYIHERALFDTNEALAGKGPEHGPIPDGLAREPEWARGGLS